MLEKHIQLMHGIKEPDVKEMTESSQSGEVKEDTKVRRMYLIPLFSLEVETFLESRPTNSVLS